jgi:exosome complex exonuclease RRP6
LALSSDPLWQISTRVEDFIVDVLVPALRPQLHILNEVFADPKIVKVFHGSDSDIIWLQRDFGLYIVNLFDTFFASKALQRKGHSLASLLLEYTTFKPDKRYQLADWRIRPLNDAMLLYARSDTHFLIHIYERLRRDLLMTDEMLAEVRRKSAGVAKQAYEHLPYDAEEGYGSGGWRNSVERAGKAPLWGLEDPAGAPAAQNWVNKQGIIALEIFKSVHDWRDRLARELDEGIGYILPNRAIFGLAEGPPKDAAGLERNMTSNFAPHIRERKDELLRLILDATERGTKKAEALRLEAQSSDTASTAPTASLWSSVVPHAQGSTSSLLGGKRVEAVSTPGLGSAMSTLFGPIGSMSSTNAAFDQILAKVHADILGPLAAGMPIPEEEPAEVKGEELEAQVALPDQKGSTIQILGTDDAKVSHGKPQASKVAGWEDDDIVSVSGRKQDKGKKRKQPDVAPAPKPAVEPYDYSKTKSVLDAPRAPVDQDPRKNKKQKKDRKGGVGAVVDGFKPAPKSMNQPKAGNKSHTFT